MTTLLAFDNDGVLRDESVSYLRCVRETVAFFDKEMADSMKTSNDDWERTHKILHQRGINAQFKTVKRHFQNLYLGKKRDYTGYINNEPWLADNLLLAKLAKVHPLVIISGAPRDEIRYTLKKNGALDYFDMIWGMHQCEGKKEGLELAIAYFRPDEICFCDDRPSPIKQARIVPHNGLKVYGIIPPQENNDWGRVLEEAGAEKVFANVKEYCRFLLDNLK